MKIAILGAGIIGITSAKQIIEQIPDVKLTIYAKDKSPNTTSDVSAGFWEPYCLNSYSDEEKAKIIKWGKETYDEMLKIAHSESASQYGVQAMSAYVLQNTENIKKPFWSNIVSQYREINDPNELNSIFKSNDTKSAFHFISTTVNVSKYLAKLTTEYEIFKGLKFNQISYYTHFRLENKGVIFIDKNLDTLQNFINETKSKNYDYLINCTGLGSKQFVNDLNLHPVRGQVIRVKASWIKYCITTDYDTSYILPLDDCVVLGGTQQYDSYDLEVNETDCQNILEKCCRLLPSLKYAQIVKKSTGLRPIRTNGIRLELDNLYDMKVIHNYGHGGSGITLCLGCANNVVELILNKL